MSTVYAIYLHENIMSRWIAIILPLLINFTSDLEAIDFMSMKLGIYIHTVAMANTYLDCGIAKKKKFRRNFLWGVNKEFSFPLKQKRNIQNKELNAKETQSIGVGMKIFFHFSI